MTMDEETFLGKIISTKSRKPWKDAGAGVLRGQQLPLLVRGGTCTAAVI